MEPFLVSSGGFGPLDIIPGQALGTVKVTYEFVPEPSAITLIGVVRDISFFTHSQVF